MPFVSVFGKIAPIALLLAAGLGPASFGAEESASAPKRNAYPAKVETYEQTHQVVFNKIDGLINQAYEKLDPSVATPDWKAITSAANQKVKDVPDARMPMRIFPDVYVVAGSDHYQRVYLVDCGDDFLLIDTGDNLTREQQFESMKRLGFRSHAPKWVFVTHCHFDHSFNSRLLQELGGEIMIHRDDAHAIATVNERTIPYHPAIRAQEFKPCQPDRLLDDGDVLRLGNKTFYVYHTPGHTAGSACLILQHDGKNILFTGDTAFFNGRLGFMQYPYNSFRQSLDSAEKLLRLRVRGVPIKVDALLSGHGTMVLAGGQEHLRRFRANVKWVLDQQAEGKDVEHVAPWEHAWQAYRKTLR